MTTIQSTTACGPSFVDPPACSDASACPTGADLVSACAEPTPADLSDAMSAMYAMMLSDQQTDCRNGTSEAQADGTARQASLAAQQQALQRQQADSGGRGFFRCIGSLLKDFTVDLTEFRFSQLASDMRTDGTACDNPKFWSQLELGAKIVAAIAAAAVTVCTAGAAGPVVVGVALALSAGGFLVQQTHCLGNASGYVGAGLALASAAVSCGGTLAASGATIASSLATAGEVASATSAGATIVSGAAHVGVAQFQADAIDAQADAQQSAQVQSFFAQIEQWALDTLQAQNQSHCDAMSTVSSAIQTDQQASLLATAPLSRG